MQGNTKVESNIPNPFQSAGNISTTSIPSATVLRHDSQIPMPSFSQPTLSSTNQNNSENYRRNSASSASGLSSMINKSLMEQTASNTNDHHIRKRSRSTLAGGSEVNVTRRRSLPSISNQNRLSIPDGTSRYSNIGLSTNTDFPQNSQYNSTTNRDPRPLRDRNFQQAIQEEIIDYLLQNKFDIETNHPVSIKSLKQPTQKGFIIIFKWLYQRIDPGYKFTKSIESDVYQILKNLQYPYLESINKSQISAVGGSSWHKFLGMLHWLARINIKLDRLSDDIDQTLINQPTQEMVSINKPIQSLDAQSHIQEKYELMVENLFINYITESYKNFLNADDNYDVAMDKLTLGFEKFTHVIESDINHLNLQNEKSFTKFQFIQDISKKFSISMEKFIALKNDLEKFKNYIDSMKQKSQEWPKKLDKMHGELDNKNIEINQAETKIREILQSLDAKGLSVETIDEKLKKKSNLIDNLDTVSDTCDKLTGIIKTKKYENNGLIQNLSSVLKHYETSLNTFFQSREDNQTDGMLFDKEKFKININESKLSNIDESVPVTNEGLFGGNVNTSGASVLENRKIELLKMNQDISLKIERLNVENNEIRDEIVKLKEEISNKNIEYQRLEKALSQIKSEIVSQKQKNESDLVVQRIEIEELQNKNQRSLQIIDRKISDAEKLLREKTNELENWKINITKESSHLKQKSEEIVAYSSNFKTSIEDSINSTKDNILEALKEIENFKLND